MKERRFDIDWLRVITIGLLLIYHVAIGFQPWGLMIGFIQNKPTLPEIWTPMTMINIWRIPLLFFVSGMGVCFAIQKRNWKELVLERSKRILVPFVFGIIAIVPLHIFLLQKYYGMGILYMPNPGHLWFLGNIFLYVLVLSPFFIFLRNNRDGKIANGIRKLFGNPLGLLVVVGFMALEAWVVQPAIYEMYAMSWHGFALGLLAFLFGFLFVFSGQTFWDNLKHWRYVFLALAVTLYGIRYGLFQLQGPGHFMAIESCFWIFAVLAFGYKYLNKPGPTLSYLSQAAYPVYIIHMVFLYLSAYLIFPLEWSPMVKFLSSTIFTFLGCFAFYEFVIRRVTILRPLFGLKVEEKQKPEIAVT